MLWHEQPQNCKELTQNGGLNPLSKQNKTKTNQRTTTKPLTGK